MADYHRFVAYIYEYVNGRKGRNAGFAKVESRNGICRIQVHIQNAVPMDGALSIFGFVRHGNELHTVLMGQGQTGGNGMDRRLTSPEDNLGGSEYGLGQLSGIWVKSESERSWATVFDDEPLDIAELERQSEHKENTGESLDSELGGDAPEHEKGSGGGKNERGESPMEEPASEENIPKENTQRENIQEGNTPEEHVQERNIQEERTLKENVQEKSSLKENVQEKSALKENTQEKAAPGENIQKEDIPKENMQEDNAPKPDVPEKTTPKENILEENVSEEDVQKETIQEGNILKKNIPEENIPKEHVLKETTPKGNAPDKDQGDQNPAKPAPAPEQKPAHSQTEMQRERRWNYVTARYPHFQPVAGEEVEDAIRIRPSDLRALWAKGWRQGSNSFMMHGYYQYRYLMLGKCRDGRYILGVPGINEEHEKYMANMFGFPTFLPAKEQQGDVPFGYWCRTMD